MTPRDLRLFCTALSFSAVAARAPSDADAERIRSLARLMETFCLRDAANANAMPPDSLPPDATAIDIRIAAIKDELRAHGNADLHYDRTSLFALYERLRRRCEGWASDAQLADRVLELIDAELDREAASDA